MVWEVLKDIWHPEENPGGYLNIGIAENSLMYNELAQHMEKSLQKIPFDRFTYGDGSMGSKRLRIAIGNFLNKHMKPMNPITMEHVVVTNGVTSALEHLSWALADPGDGFLLGRPFYEALLRDFQFRPGAKVVQVAFGSSDPIGYDAISKYEEAIFASAANGIKIKGLILCNPHNPLGRCYSRETITGIMQLCQKHRVHLLSDEIYALSVWKNNEDSSPPPTEFVSALSVESTGIIDPSLIHILWGMSKDFGANGIRIGALISQSNIPLLNAVSKVGRFSYPSSISDLAATLLLEDDAFTENYIRTNQDRLSKAYSFCVQRLREHSIQYAPGVNAAYFLWINLGAAYLARHPNRSTMTVGSKFGDAKAAISDQDQGVDLTDEIMKRMLDHRVFLGSGKAFGSEKPGWFRMVFSHNQEILEEGFNRIFRAIDIQAQPRGFGG